MFANRPYWRWQTQGNFFLGFNAILNWNDLDAGRARHRRPARARDGKYIGRIVRRVSAALPASAGRAPPLTATRFPCRTDGANTTVR